MLHNSLRIHFHPVTPNLDQAANHHKQAERDEDADEGNESTFFPHFLGLRGKSQEYEHHSRAKQH